MSTSSGSSLWFTSDLHFGHANIIKHTERPFATVEEMDAVLIERWNAVVAPGDSVYVVGDFSFHKPARSAEIFHALHGQKFLVRGNHDRDDKTNALFAWEKDLYTVKVPDPDAHGGKQRIELCHYAMRVFNQSHRGAWALHGHSHGSLPDDPNALSIDVGVDSHDFTPWSYEQIKARMALKTWKAVDHHARGVSRMSGDPTMPCLIGLAGLAGSGKDTVADFLSEVGFLQRAFATPLKEACRTMFQLTDRQLYGDQKETLDAFWGETPRAILQRVGTECMRRGFSNDIWIRIMERSLVGLPHVVISDVRFRNEAEAVRRWGGVVWYITRPGAGASGGITNHSSEHDLDGTHLSWFRRVILRQKERHPWNFDAVIDNSGTLESLRQRVLDLEFEAHRDAPKPSSAL